MNIPDEKYGEIAKAAQEIATLLIDIDTLGKVDSVEIYYGGVRMTVGSRTAALRLARTAETVREGLLADLKARKAEFRELLEED
ncbi:MAG: hypothetical protein LUC24_00825 [Bacteroidales bacterium]|nr:hypothetical protein [Bacteroidales bacterium]